jgi:Ser/Thr protein kinase RdoA (MazF antagonist)
MDAVVEQVLSAYPSPLRGTVEALGNRGGFSGARIWRVHGPGGPLCLRAGAPAEGREHLQARHRLMRLAREAGLRFVPRVMNATSGETVIEAGGLAWELQEWMPGQADFREAPSPSKLQAAARALARVHLAWEHLGGGEACPCPAVERRIRSGSVRDRCFARPVAYAPGSEARLRDAVARWLPCVPEMLRPAHQPCRLQPCLRDVWHAHLLYHGEELTGLVDYAAVAEDSPAADVARMLGSLVEDDGARWHAALKAYREVRPLSQQEEQLARVLDRTGVIVALANWQRWLGEPGRAFEDQGRVNARIEELLQRVERWPGIA